MAEACPPQEILRGFAHGALDGTGAAAVEEHVRHCLRCAEALDQLTRMELGRLIRPETAAGLTPPTGARLAAVMSAARELPPQMTTDGGLATDPARVLELLGPAESPESLGTFAGYEILEVTGRGGMGLVLKARDRTLNRIVAIKVLAPGGDDDAAFNARFLDEARAVAAIHHDHIVTVHHAGLASGLAYLVMPFHDGGTLEQHLARAPRMAPNEIARIGHQLALALAATHARGTLHRDIKPSNVLLEDGLKRVRLADFGLARPVRLPIEAGSGVEPGIESGYLGKGSRTVAGTPHYMSPEQAQGCSVDERSDLFSLGALLYHLATGRTLHPPGSAAEVLAAAARGTSVVVGAAAPELPPGLAAIIDRLLEPGPANRFGTAADLAAALERELRRDRPHVPVRWGRVALGAMAAVLLISGLILVLDLSGATSIINAALARRTGEGWSIQGRIGTFANLAAAVASAEPGAVVEARFSNEQLVDSLRLGGKPLIIRAAVGFTPILIATNNNQPMILVDAPLALEGLTLWRRAARINTPVLASIEDAPLHLLNCRLLRSRFAGQNLLAQGRLRPVTPGDPLRYRALLGFQYGSRGHIQNCLFAGIQATAIGMRASRSQPTRVEFDNNVLAIDRTVLLNPEANAGVSLFLRRMAVLTGALLDIDEVGVVEGIAIALEDATIDRSGGAMIRVNQSHAGELLRSLRWTETNVVYAGPGSFVINRRRFTLDDESIWNESLGLSNQRHHLTLSTLFPPTLVRSILQLLPSDSDLALAPNPKQSGTPEASLPPDRRGAAASVAPEVIGPGEAYDRFRQSPAYREWERRVRLASEEWSRAHRSP